MLNVYELEKSYGDKVLFDGASFTMTPGERLGMVGRNGSGKTTFFKILLGQETVDTGRIELPKHYSIGHLSQHIAFTEETILGEACLGLPEQEGGWYETYKAEAALMGLGFPLDRFETSPLLLSGGYQVRLQLAKVLLAEPNLLLLDEPTNYLDIVSVRWLKRFLRTWPNELVLITHDQDFMNSVTTHTVAIHRGKMRRMPGSTTKIYEILAQDEEIHEKTRVNSQKARRQQERFIDRFRAKASKARQVQSRIKQLSKQEKLDELDAISTLEFQFRSAAFSGAYLLQCSDVTFGYEEDQVLIQDLSIDLEKGDKVAVIGKNGKGKSTFLNLVAGELSTNAGSIRLQQNTRVAHYGQDNIDRLSANMTVEEEIIAVHPEHDRKASRGICGLMMFEGDDAEKPISVLSGGERARVLLGKLLVSPANLLLLDEPTNHLDMDSIDSLIEAIASFQGGAVIVTHNERVLHAVANRLIIFDQGETRVFDGTYQQFLEKVGWSDESDDKGQKAKPTSTNKKEARRKRAEVVAARTKALRPLKRKVDLQEAEIISLEERLAEVNEKLLKASEAGDRDGIQRLSPEHFQIQQGIEKAFRSLEAATQEHDRKSQDFDKRLEGLKG